MTVAQGYRTVTVASAIAGITGITVVLLLGIALN
jgi:H+/gluconate symporter-like permease